MIMRFQEHTSFSEHLQEEYSFTGQFTRRRKIGKLAQGSDLKKKTHTPWIKTYTIHLSKQG